jgi:hypothetical protein
MASDLRTSRDVGCSRRSSNIEDDFALPFGKARVTPRATTLPS